MDNIDDFDSYISQAATWHTHFVQLLHKIDPHDHPITTSFGAVNPTLYKPVWDTVDFTQIHDYGSADMTTMATGTIESMGTAFPNRPCWVGEFGTGQTAANQGDPSGVNIHNEQWGSLMGRGSSGGSTWWLYHFVRCFSQKVYRWWDSYVDPYNLYPISKFVFWRRLGSKFLSKLPIPSWHENPF